MGEVGATSFAKLPTNLLVALNTAACGAGAQRRRRPRLFMKDLHLMLSEGRRLNIPLPLTKVAERLYAAAANAGRGSEDLASVITALESLASTSS